MNKMNIAIDGPASSGKSTVAKIVAKKLDYIYINTGLMYRAVAYNALQKGIDLQDETKVSESFVSGMIKLLPNEVVELHGKKIVNELRDDVISNGASTIARYESVRTKCVSEQQKMAEEKGVVMDGRDITSIVLPNAEIKVFMWASPEERANRRIKQNKELGYSTNYQKILKEINDRDFQDMNRKIGPLVKVADAVKLDTTNYSIDQVVEEIIKMVK